jgi:hypothetical protein
MRERSVEVDSGHEYRDLRDEESGDERGDHVGERHPEIVLPTGR